MCHAGSLYMVRWRGMLEAVFRELLAMTVGKVFSILCSHALNLLPAFQS
jgi:hypothetical protein